MKKTMLFLLALMLCPAWAYAQSGNLIVNNYLGVGGVTNPAHAVDVNGDVNVTGNFLVKGSPLSPGAALMGAVCGLRIANDAGNPNTQIDLSANYIGTVVPSGALNINCALSGQTGGNDLDTGTLQASKWYYIWVIYNGTTVAGLASLSSTSPTMPSGFTYSRLVGAAVTDSNAHFLVFVQQGNHWIYDSYQTVSTGTAVMSWTTQNCSTFIPPISTRGWLQVYMNGKSGSQSFAYLRRNGSTSTYGHTVDSTFAGIYVYGNDWIDTDSSQNVQLMISGNLNNWSFEVLGFELNL